MASSRSTAQRRRARSMARQTAYARATATPGGATADAVEGEEVFEDDRASVRWPVVAGLIISVLGLADAAYLTYTHYSASHIAGCSTHGFVDCAAVTTSRYSHILGVPVALLGLLYFVCMIPLMLPVAWRSTNRLLRTGRLAAAVVGVGMIVWLIYVELVKLDQLCEYCTGVHVLTFALFVVVAMGTIATAPDPD